MIGKTLSKIEVIIFLSFFLFFSIFGYFYNKISPPKGDEIHHLLTAISIIKDHDLSLTNNYADKDYYIFFQGNLDKHTIIGRGGNEYLYHGLGVFQFMIAPFYWLDGRMGVIFFLSFVSALLIYQIYRYCYETTKARNISFLVSIFIGLNLPIVQYSILIFAEIIAACILIKIIRVLSQKNINNLLLTVLIGILSWIHMRFLPIAILILLYWIFKNRKDVNFRKVFYWLLTAVLIFGYFIFIKYLFGTFDPTKPIKEGLHLQNTNGNILINLVNILIDRSYGLLIYSPLYLLLFPGLFFWYKKNKQSFFLTTLVSIIYLLTVLSFFDWNGGFSPPARYLTPILPILTPAIVYCLIKLKKIFAYLILFFLGGFGIMSFYINISSGPNYGFIYMDGFSPFLFKVSQFVGINIYSLFPAYYPTKTINIAHLFWLIFFAFLIFIFTRKPFRNPYSK